MIKVSVIVPVYNTESYLEEAVRSIMNQTLSDIEIIIIDDGSTDNSLSVIKKLADEDNRISVYSQTNQGLSNTRNFGIEVSGGEFVYFMDSDDILDIKTLEECYNLSVEKRLDFVFFDAESFSEVNNISLGFDYGRTYLFEQCREYSGKEMLERMLQENKYRASACLNFINKAFIEHNKLRFYPRIIHEDELFTAQLYLFGKRVSCIQEVFYYRRLRDNSIMMNRFTCKNVEGYLTVIKQLKLISEKEADFETTIDRLIAYILNPAIYKAKELPMKFRIRLMQNCVRYGYIRYITMKNRVVLIFPFLITIKSVLKKE